MKQLAQLIEEGRITDPQSARGRLLAKAAHLFKEKGYERTTVRDLAASVGIQSGSIFHHFRSKEDILFAVMEETILYITAKMREALERAPTARDRLLALLRCELESVLGGTGEAMTVLVYEWRSLSDARQEEILKLRDQYEGLWLDTLSEARDAGLVKGDVAVLRRFLTGALSWTITWYKSEGSMTVEDLAQQALYLVVKD
ncbi:MULTISPECIES: TetR/AcrR family transcriptional regulator [unclassified Hahella]|uniref:TetR/AcrR family transcriptional regulator n=1 Tax=unclassified Hahella TaxID=2624107 RepID=UPI001C1EF220|nr:MULTISPECIES: TetR/AcrR family transcriptional regulator [unclassified Hahella]MBU6951935.1 TetR/AcrR family transcriptional regulator [Hahella sp. HN01]MDG9670825.1 TetR/AcrR family transcriptional regulator [Hahella sp. CR1]